MMRVKARKSRTIVRAEISEQLFCLFAELHERRTRRQRRGRNRHKISFRYRPRPHDGLKEDQTFSSNQSGGLGPFRGRGASCDAIGTYPRQRRASMRTHSPITECESGSKSVEIILNSSWEADI